MATSSAPGKGGSPTLDGTTATRMPFPQSVDEFGSDPRVSFSKLDEKYILEDDDGSEWEWQPAVGTDAQAGKGRWVQSVDESLVEQQRQAYASPGVDNETTTAGDKKRKTSDGGVAAAQVKKQKIEKAPPDRKNTAIYVTKLPLDTDLEEVQRVFSRCGLIAQNIDNDEPRIRLYADDQGNLKGDALIVFFRRESIQLAIDLMDGAEFRLGDKSTVIGVKEADWNYKKVKTAELEETLEGNGQSGKSKAKAAKEKQKIKARTQAMNNRLADWDDDDPQVLPETNPRFDKVVVLKHMFTLKELEEDPAAVLEIKEDVRDECGKVGEVTNVVLYDKEEDGVVTVRFGNAQSAKACVNVMNGRYFSQQKVEAYIFDGKDKFKKSGKKTGDDEEENRLDDFGDWLEGHDSKVGDEIR
ncbi:MAG: hypothetical protein M1821_007012 [Bathelium mastoideum]|nr:MAG: hypothetical protein M1821_007012 [Bathelium mastoideum]KAI9683464.1 MAG: hypothetical protein M1822_006004 [Bathelium mastoideum]